MKFYTLILWFKVLNRYGPVFMPRLQLNLKLWELILYSLHPLYLEVNTLDPEYFSFLN